MGKMKIDRTNYELFVTGYLDGTLNTIETAELLVFLEQNPDLKEEASDLASIMLQPDSEILFGFKEALVQPADRDAKNLNRANFSHYFIASFEGDLSAEGKKEVNMFLDKNPELIDEYEKFSLARLVADKNIRFPKPGSLKQKTIGKTGFWFAGVAAAIILIMMILFFRPEIQRPDGYADVITSDASSSTQQPDNKPDTIKPVIKASQETDRTINPAPKTRKVETPKTTREIPVIPTENNAPLNRVKPKSYQNITPVPFSDNSRNFYSDLFDEITRSQEPLLEKLEPEANQPATSLQPLARTKAAKKINGLIRSGAQIASLVPESINGWMLADLGIEGINLLTENDLKLRRISKPDGQTEKIIITENGSGYAIGRKQN